MINSAQKTEDEMNNMATKELVPIYNELAKRLDKPVIRDFKAGKVLLVEKILALEDEIEDGPPMSDLKDPKAIAAASKELVTKFAQKPKLNVQTKAKPASVVVTEAMREAAAAKVAKALGTTAAQLTQPIKENEMKATTKPATKVSAKPAVKVPAKPAAKVAPKIAPKAPTSSKAKVAAALGVVLKPKAPAAKAPVAKTKVGGIGAFAKGLILDGKDNAKVLAEVQKKFPDASTSASCISWYRNKLRAEGAKV